MSHLRKVEPSTPDPVDPWKDDQLDRAKIIKSLTPLITNLEQPFVISLQSPFGTGKTYLVKRWLEELRSGGYYALYFDAWQTDLLGDPLTAFMAEINSQLNEMLKRNIPKTQEKISKALRAASTISVGIAKQMPRMALRAGGKLLLGDTGTNEFVDNWGEGSIESATNALESTLGINDDVKEEIVTEFFDTLGKVIERELKKESELYRSLDVFRNGFEKIIKKLPKQDPKKRKLIIFVDELDRCRPDYAIHVLECIKHFFAVPGLIFVLTVDENQLRQSFQAVYGPNLDADAYGRKFIDWKLKITTNDLRSFIVSLTKKFNLHPTVSDEIYSSFPFWAIITGMSLRDIEHAFTEIILITREPFSGVSSGYAPRNFPLSALPTVMAIKHGMPETYSAFFEINEIRIEKLIDTLKAPCPRLGLVKDWERHFEKFQMDFYDKSTGNGWLRPEFRQSFGHRGAPEVSAARKIHSMLENLSFGVEAG